MYPKIVHSKSPIHGHDPKILFLHQYKTVPSVYNKTHLGGPQMPQFEANMNYIPISSPGSMKQCNKSASVKFHMALPLITTTGSNLPVVGSKLKVDIDYTSVENSSLRLFFT